MFLKCFVNDSEMLFNNFEKLSNDFEMFFNDFFWWFKQQFEEFWESHLQRGAGRFSALPPFVGMLSHKLFRLVLKSLKKS